MHIVRAQPAACRHQIIIKGNYMVYRPLKSRLSIAPTTTSPPAKSIIYWKFFVLLTFHEKGKPINT